MDNLTDEEAGKLFKAIYEYVDTKEEILTGMFKSVFLTFKNYIDMNEKKWNDKIDYDKQRYEMKKSEINGKSEIALKSEIPLNSHIHTHIHTPIHNSNIIIKKDRDRGMGEEKENLVTDDASLLAEITKKIIEHLNSTANSHYRYSSKLTQSKINSRLNEGYKLNDFIVVINKKSKEWIGTEFEVYLNPETLFGNKFEKYLNQKIIEKKKTSSNNSQMEILKGVHDGTIKIN